MEDNTLVAQWCVDSETGEKILIDTHTWQIIARKDKDGKIVEDCQ